MEFLVFLGAGCSAEFEVPTMKEMVKDFKQDIKSRQQESYLYKKILAALNKKNGRCDLETVLDVLEKLSKKGINGPFESFILATLNTNKFDIANELTFQNADELKKGLKEFLFKKCTFDNKKYEENKKVFDDFWKFMEYLGINKGNSGLNFNLYTTNYDRYLDVYLSEKYSRNYKSSVSDYFDTNSNPPIFNVPAENILPNYRPHNEYVKFHGSIDWYLSPDRTIKRTIEPFKDDKGGMMMYPISEKPLYLEPWNTLLSLFKRALKQADTWIAIGYSFNDEYLRSIFEEQLISGEHLLAILGKDGENVAKDHFNGRSDTKGFNCKFASLDKCQEDIKKWLTENR